KGEMGSRLRSDLSRAIGRHYGSTFIVGRGRSNGVRESASAVIDNCVKCMVRVPVPGPFSPVGSLTLSETSNGLSAEPLPLFELVPELLKFVNELEAVLEVQMMLLLLAITFLSL